MPRRGHLMVQLLAVGRYRSVELLDSNLQPVETIAGVSGQVNAIRFLPNGNLFVAGGEPGLAGEVGVWDRETRQPLWKQAAHRDAVTAGAVSGDGTLLATGSYDQTIIVWDAATGEQKATLTGHNGAVFGLAFHPQKPILASASADRTIKLWDAATGARLDTLTEPTKDQNAIAFSPDGQFLAAAGADSRIRIWTFSDGTIGTTRIRISHFAHEGPIVALNYAAGGAYLVTSSEDRTVKIWDAGTLKQATDPAPQPDWVAAIAASGDQVALGRLNGSVARLELPSVSAFRRPRADRRDTSRCAEARNDAVRTADAGGRRRSRAERRTRDGGLSLAAGRGHGSSAGIQWID